jgi:4-aminobutyrate--pyruvate transaminase
VTPNQSSLSERDTASLLHGYTNARQHLTIGPLVIERGDGIYVVDSDGRRYIEALAGLWSVALGFSEERLVGAAVRQMRDLPFYHTFSHKSHRPLIELAEKLISIAPVPMSKVFFTSSGSEAIDSVLKFIWYRSNALGEPKRKKVISRDRAYHGVTIAAGSLTGLPNNHRSFDLPINGILRAGCPHWWRNAKASESEEEFSKRLAQELDALIQAEGPETIAAFFGEPVMGAGGVVVPPAGYWSEIQKVLRKYDILFVADEVICGFGRTGQMFGSNTYDLQPDVMVMSKQISSSYLPISAVMINERVFEPLADESNRIGVLGHGFTSGGHPVAAAVAVENIKIIEERNLVEHAARMGEHMQASLRDLTDHELVGEVRGVGLIAAVELVSDKTSKLPLGTVGQLGTAACDALLKEGVISRNMGDALAICPPLIITEPQIDDLTRRLKMALDRTRDSVPRRSQLL